ncbi:MAG: flagellar export chaperone FliS [Mariprofundaceae bacterium]
MTGYNAYQGNQVNGSGPLGLVLLSYEALYKSIGHVRRAIEAGDLAAEVDHTSRAIEAIIELATSLQAQENDQIAASLASLYAYMVRRLNEGMCTCSLTAIDEVSQLVETLREGWQELHGQQNDVPKARVAAG